jgi:hypothetical protein
VGPSDRPYDAALGGWFQNAVAQHALAPFHAIIADVNPTANADVVLVEDVDETHPLMMSAHSWEVVRSRRDAVRACLARARLGQGPDEFVRQQGWVLIAFQNAFRHLTIGTPIKDALFETVSKGGDTDTNAAICGALLGVAQGRAAIPYAGAWQCWPVARSLRAPASRGPHAIGQTMYLCWQRRCWPGLAEMAAGSDGCSSGRSEEPSGPSGGLGNPRVPDRQTGEGLQTAYCGLPSTTLAYAEKVRPQVLSLRQ